LLAIYSRQSSLGFVAKTCSCRRYSRNKAYLNDEQKKQFEHPHYAEVKAGEAIFHHSLTLHGSGENKSDKPRRAFVINAFADGVISDSNEPLLERSSCCAERREDARAVFPFAV
jgi:ectoine hydroxylase-related dioxygenase (phytanoyl-CoA dioxygenase family)